MNFRVFLLVVFSFCFFPSFSQCVLSGSPSQIDVLRCLMDCSCNRINIADGSVVTITEDWDLTSAGDIDIVIYGSGQLVFQSSGNNINTLIMTADSSLTFQDPNNTEPIVVSGSQGNNIPRIIVGNDEYDRGDFGSIIDNGGINPIVLPIKLISFDVEMEGNQSIIKWVTASEQDNKGFGLMRNGEEIAFLTSQGNSNSNKLYSYTDAFPPI